VVETLYVHHTVWVTRFLNRMPAYAHLHRSVIDTCNSRSDPAPSNSATESGGNADWGIDGVEGGGGGGTGVVGVVVVVGGGGGGGVVGVVVVVGGGGGAPHSGAGASRTNFSGVKTSSVAGPL
jgi:hypothetical protein